MLRLALLHLSRSGYAARIVDTFPGVRGFSRRFVAGGSLAEAMAAVRRLSDQALHVTVSFLGENVSTEAGADAARDEYLRLIEAIAVERLDPGISVKLTQLGLRLDYGRCRDRLAEVLEAAGKRGPFVRIDMEESAVVEATLAMYREMRSTGHERLGVVIQSYLRRSRADMEALAREGASVRLVKGAYLEPPALAFPRKADVDRSFRELIDVFARSRVEGSRLAVATHDRRMIEYALDVFGRQGVPEAQYEFQMMYGIRPDLQRRFRAEGRRVRIYAPYGSQWYPYLMRRLAERPANLWFFVGNLRKR